MKTKRPAARSLAIILLILASLWNLFATLLLTAGPAPAPAIVVYGSAVLGALGLVAAWGLWKLTRWGKGLSILVSALSGLELGVGGIVNTDSPRDTVIAWALLAVSAAIIVLVLVPAARTALAMGRGQRAQEQE